MFRRALRCGAAALALVGLMATTSMWSVPAAGADPATPLSTGGNGDGQLATGNKTSRLQVGTTILTDIVVIEAGRATGYALDADGDLWAWGDNSKGAIGDGTYIDRPNPVRVMSEVRQIAAGDDHVLALTFSEEVYVWGAGGMGQLGLGTTTNRPAPTLLPWSDAEQLAAGSDSSYIFETGLIYSFGGNSHGELGDGTTVNRLRPTAVTGIQSFEGVMAGRDHAFAIDDHGVWAWGANQYGQLGDGTTTRRTRAVQVLDGSTLAVQAGSDHSVARREDGTLVVWGRGQRGQLGLGTTTNRLLPTALPGVGGITSIGVGFDQTFATTASGQVLAWGWNDKGQVGDGTTVQRNSPVAVPGVGQISQVATGRAMTYFLPGLTPPPQSVILADDFADGLADWSHGAGMTVDPTVGSPSDAAPSIRAAVVNAASSATSSEADFFEVDEGCASVGVRVTSVGGTSRYALMKLRTRQRASIARIQIDSAMRLSVRADIPGTTYATATTVAAGSWNRLTLCVATSGTNGTLELRVNGASVGTWVTNTGLGPIGLIQLGDNDPRTATVNWDDVVLTSGLG